MYINIYIYIYIHIGYFELVLDACFQMGLRFWRCVNWIVAQTKLRARSELERPGARPADLRRRNNKKTRMYIYIYMYVLVLLLCVCIYIYIYIYMYIHVIVWVCRALGIWWAVFASSILAAFEDTRWYLCKLSVLVLRFARFWSASCLKQH